METSKNTYSIITDSIEPITRIDFSIYSNNDVIKDSAIENQNGKDPNGIVLAEIYNNNEPVEGGVVDKRLGVTEGNLECSTCGERALKCPGHFGHIKFVEPVFHMGYLPYIKIILSCICIRCHKLLVYKNEDEVARLLKNKTGKQRFAEIKNLTKGVTYCQKTNYGCGTPAHHIYIDKKNTNVFLLAVPIKRSGDSDDTGEDKKKRTPQILTPQFCYDMLRLISDEDCMIMGMDPKKSRPEDMIITNFPVPPVPVRPSIRIEIGSSTTTDDDLTHKLVDIIKNHENLKDAKGDGSLSKVTSINDDFTLLQFHVATFFDNQVIGSPKSQQKNNKQTKSLSERLKGKEGRVRGNLMGKRVDMSGRTVITSDPFIALNEVGIPINIAMNLTYPVIVNKDNIDYLSQLVKNGRNKYPGANFVIKSIIDKEGNETKQIVHLKYRTKLLVLKPGDTVERHLVDGDIVLFNRQPSLHKMSMMGHKIHVLKDPQYLTFRVNVSVTGPYNADFDGDEMNIHIPQSIQTVTELFLIANASLRFISPATSKIAINAKQDTLMGSYLLTNKDTLIDWKDAMNILMATSKGLTNKIIKGKKYVGRYMYSQIIPSKINIVKTKDNGEFIMRILNGYITDGQLGGSEITNILHKTWFQCGSRETTHFIDDLQRMILKWLIRYGFTVGIGDAIVPDKVHRYIKDIIETKRKEVLSAITEYENDPEIMTYEAFELNIQGLLRETIQANVEKIIMNNFKTEGGLFIAISSGSSGAAMNAGQIIGCVGQVIVESKRIPKKFNNRTIPMFYQHDDSGYARGFCSSSFLKGLDPAEFFFHVMAGREGIINTAIKTADTGYIQRKLIKILEDIKVEYDGTVRNANDKIIQYVYGDNGINTEKQIEQKIELVTANNNIIREKYIHSKEEITEFRNKYSTNDKYTVELNEQLYRKLVSMRDRIRTIQKLINTSAIAFRDTYMMPVDLKQYILEIINKENRKNDIIVDPYYVLSKIKEMYSGSYSKITKYNNPTSIKKEDEKKIKFLLKFYLYDTLAPKKCTDIYKLNKEEFDEIVMYFRKTLLRAKIEGGEMVGFIAAQSIGEPITQVNLKSFHKSGTGKTVSYGLPRIKELLGASKNIRTPITKIILEDYCKNDKIAANKIASHLKYTTLRDIIDNVDIYYDPNPHDENSIMRKDEVDNVFEAPQGKMGCQNKIQGLPWILRLTLSKEKMIDRNINMTEIKTSFCHNWSSRYEDAKGPKKDYKKILDKISQCAIVSNYDNSQVPIIHIRFDANNYNYGTFIQFQDMIINKYKIKGILGIDESNNIQEETYVDFDEEGNRQNKKQYVIITEGINLSEIAQINGINLSETICNDIETIREIYGIEAARSTYIKEFMLAITDSGGYSNYQHIEMLADAVTHMGGIIPVNRHGANKLDTDPFSRASFEKTVEQMLAAAAFGESDHIRSVSARIMVGSLINGGTGCFDLLLDHDKVKKVASRKPIIQQSSVVIKKSTAIENLIKRKKKID
uniref:DNA-directed RNA polymerase n=1 Tax=viral metagenome TaxID=1070528 RepID=A0A6C0LQ64_9ZZZZ